MSTKRVIPESECQFSFARSGGKGGQNVNKVSTKVLLRWHPASSGVLTPQEKSVIYQRLQGSLTAEGEILVVSQTTRSQEMNRADALEKLSAMVTAALTPRKKRRATKPTRSSRERRIGAKKKRSEQKSSRSGKDWQW